MSGVLHKELEGLNLNSAGGGRCRRRGTYATESVVDAFCKIVYKAMLVTAEGYLYTSDIANNIYDDVGIDPYKKTLDLGFNSFSAFLHSEHMKKYIEIDFSNSIISYHAIITPEILATIGHIQREQRTAFLNLNRRNYPSRRLNASSGSNTISPQQFLKERMRKRELQAQMEENNQLETMPNSMDSMSNNNQYEIEDIFLEEIGENEQMGLDEIKWVLNDSAEGEETLFFCET